MTPQTKQKSAASAVTYNSGQPWTYTATTNPGDSSGDSGGNGNPGDIPGGDIGNPTGRNPGGLTAPPTGGTPTTGGGSDTTGNPPTGVVGVPTIDQAARQRDQQDSLLRRRGRRNFLTTGPRGAGVPEVVVRGLSGFGSNPTGRGPTNFPGERENPVGGGNPTGRKKAA